MFRKTIRFVIKESRGNLVYLIPPKNKVERGKDCLVVMSFELQQAFGEITIIESIKPLIAELQKLVTLKMEEISSRLHEFLNQIPPEKIYLYLQKANSNRITLNQTQIDTLITK